jgi:sugar O-acyltransferase (sialic acid O-acetyltransferase NeuD family)
VVADSARLDGRWSEIAFLDDRFPDVQVVDGLPVLGRFGAAAELQPLFADVIVAVGDNHARLQVLRDLQQNGLHVAVVAHPSSAISDHATVGSGTVIMAQCAVNPGARLGGGCIINTGATVDHDCDIGQGAHLSPGVHLGGNVTIGERSWLGVGVSVRDGVTIGADVIVGVGAAVTTDLPDGVTAVGVPARVIRTRDGGADVEAIGAPS